MKEGLQYNFYGTEASASEVGLFLQHIIRSNELSEQAHKRKTPVCIWGFHGIGKTELVESFAKDNGFGWSYIAPAQFEEMGDLLGMPTISNGKTVFVPPEWVPQHKGPGILLIDDVNRADDRILRGIMQLLQHGRLSSWALPEGWHIVLTANPDGGDYSVTPMDDAMLTRMMHITMRFDVKEWAKWAEKSKVDERGINFVLTYPEIINSGERSTPRSLVHFFQSIEHIEDLEKEIGMVNILADSCLDKATATAFITFINDKLGQIPSPSSIVQAEDFESEILVPLREMTHQETLRIDLLSTLGTRLVNYLIQHDIQPDSTQLGNIKSFLKIDFIPNDLRFGMARELMDGNESLQAIMSDPELGNLLLENM